MKSIWTTLILSALLVGLCEGCASSRRSAIAQNSAESPTTQITIGPATRPADAKASLRLAEIEPAPKLPTTQSADPNAPKPPLEALELYARARDALAGGHQFTAISALERAIKLDPTSAELHRLLSRAYIAGGNTGKATETLERATQLAPDDLRSQVSLARLYLQQGRAPDATDRLRLGLQTKQYENDEAAAAVTDYFLAKSLQQQGYDRAALDQYEKLLERLGRRSLALRSDAELADWSARPQSIFSDVARLYERQGQHQKALDTWRQVARFDSDDLETRSHIIDSLIAIGQNEQAFREAALAVRQTGATSRALEILRDVANRTGQDNAVYDELRRLQQERPDDRSLLFARVDLLASNGREDEAQATLEQAARLKFDSEIVRRLVRFYSDRGKTIDATKLLIEAATAKPDDTPALVELYSDLLQPRRPDAPRPAAVQKIEVAPGAEAAKQYFLALAAFLSNREVLAREALEKATHLEPLFPPAYRFAINNLIDRSDLDTAAKGRAAQDLIDRAEKLGPPGLAQELRAQRLVSQQLFAEAIVAYERAFQSRAPTPEAAIAYAVALERQGNTAKVEQTLWRLVSDHPTFEQAYQFLIVHYSRPGGSTAAAMNALQRWRAADPSSVSARLKEAELLIRSPQSREMTRQLISVINENPQNSRLLNRVAIALRGVNQTSTFTRTLEELLARNPKNIVAALFLQQMYLEANQADNAARVAEKARDAAAGDARLLYLVSQLFNGINQKQQSRDVLTESLRLDPDDAATNNDLGYTWADDGVNLDRAEAMIRLAVDTEPDNVSFLDSLGWVLYKRGQFEEARRQLERAVSIDSDGDPVALDHLGDTLYRLNNSAAAQAQWRKSLEHLVLSPNRPDIDTLRPALEGKLQQAQMGQPVNVAPVSSESKPASPVQAKN